MVQQAEAVLPLLILPPKAWWEAAAQPGARIGLSERFPKQTFRNRLRISNLAQLGTADHPSSRPHLDFSIPLRHDAGRTGWTARLDGSVPWRKALWRTLQTQWAGLPFWEILGPELEPLVNSNEPLWHKYVHDLNSWMASQWGGTLPALVEERPSVDFSPKHEPWTGAAGISWCEALLREGPALYL